MTSFHRVLMAAALAFSLTLPTVFAQAQGAPPTAQDRGFGGGYGPGMMWGGRGYGPGMMWGWRGGNFGDPQAADQFVQRRLASVKASLKITAGQAPLWDKFAETVRADAKTMIGQRAIIAKRDGSQDTLPDRLQVREELLAVQLDSMRKMIAALRPLYAAFDADQKAVADDLMGFGMMRGPGMF